LYSLATISAASSGLDFMNSTALRRARITARRKSPFFSAISTVYNFGTSSILNPGPHGLSEILYSFTSQAGNNGSAFGGLTTNTPWYNIAGAFTMLMGRFFMKVPMLAIAGNLAQKKYVPPSLGTFPVTTPLFTVLLLGVILIVGALTFFPALSLGPLLEHLLMMAGKAF